jgi:hypothetical protein
VLHTRISLRDSFASLLSPHSHLYGAMASTTDTMKVEIMMALVGASIATAISLVTTYRITSSYQQAEANLDDRLRNALNLERKQHQLYIIIVTSSKVTLSILSFATLGAGCLTSSKAFLLISLAISGTKSVSTSFFNTSLADLASSSSKAYSLYIFESNNFAIATPTESFVKTFIGRIGQSWLYLLCCWVLPSLLK